MKSRIKRYQAISLMLLVLLNCLFVGAQTQLPKVGKVYTDYGLESEMRIPSRVMRRAMSKLQPGVRVREMLKSLRLFRQAGGIMFDAAAQPCARLANLQLRLSYDRTKPDGRRLILHTGAEAYTVDGVYDGDLRPIAEFANDVVPILTNVQSPDGALRQSCPLPGNLKIVTLHPAFRNTSLGRQLTSIDSIPWSFSYGERWDSQEQLPQATVNLSKSLASLLLKEEKDYNNVWPKLWLEFINAGQSVLNSMDAEQKRHYAALAETYSKINSDWESIEAEILAIPGLNKPAWNMLSVRDRRILLLYVDSLRTVRVSNFNDDEAPPVFCTNASAVNLGGTPQVKFIAPRYGDNYSLPDSSRLLTKNIAQLRLVDQEAYDALIKIYRVDGLFRYVKQQSPLSWKQFLRSLPPKEMKDTYTIVCADCKKAAVEQWLACVEKNDFSKPVKANRR